MTIYLDPTEARDNTRLPQSVVSVAQELSGLERATGADLLISSLDRSHRLSQLNYPLTLPQELNLKKHIESGLLVQRKSGRDFTSSIPKLNSILYRMLQWTQRPWLLIIADLKVNQQGYCLVDGVDSGFTWVAVEGALCWWQLRGGMISILSRETLIAPWVSGWVNRLTELNKNEPHVIRRPIQQRFLLPVQTGRVEKKKKRRGAKK